MSLEIEYGYVEVKSLGSILKWKVQANIYCLIFQIASKG